MSWYQKKGLFIMHLYLKYQSSSTYGSKDIAQVKVFFKTRSVFFKTRSQGQKSWYQKKGLLIMHLYLKYQSSSAYGSKNIVQVKVFQN
jgi:hypothetical protein